MERLDFDVAVDQIGQLSRNAQATFLYKLMQKLGPAILRTAIRYAGMKLDDINMHLPDDHPYKQKFLRLRAERRLVRENERDLGPAVERNMDTYQDFKDTSVTVLPKPEFPYMGNEHEAEKW